MEKKKILSVKDLVIHYETENAVVEAVNGVSFDILESEAVGLVGETALEKLLLPWASCALYSPLPAGL